MSRETGRVGWTERFMTLTNNNTVIVLFIYFIPQFFLFSPFHSVARASFNTFSVTSMAIKIYLEFIFYYLFRLVMMQVGKERN